MNCLSTYCSWSRQAVSLENSGSFFSKGCMPSLRTSSNLSGALIHFHRILCIWGSRNFFFLTRKDFNYVKEKLEARTSSWKCKALSWQGQATLIKSVALAIPTYIMAVCKFPKGLCEEMDSMLKCFWWGANQESSQYFTPTAWSKLCTPKMKEGWVLEALVT